MLSLFLSNILIKGRTSYGFFITYHVQVFTRNSALITFLYKTAEGKKSSTDNITVFLVDLAFAVNLSDFFFGFVVLKEFTSSNRSLGA